MQVCMSLLSVLLRFMFLSSPIFSCSRNPNHTTPTTTTPSAAARLSHNRLESLRQDLLLPNLLSTIEILQLSNNNLLELPAIFDG